MSARVSHDPMGFDLPVAVSFFALIMLGRVLRFYWNRKSVLEMSNNSATITKPSQRGMDWDPSHERQLWI
jgi:hypothetical protein